MGAVGLSCFLASSIFAQAAVPSPSLLEGDGLLDMIAVGVLVCMGIGLAVLVFKKWDRS